MILFIALFLAASTVARTDPPATTVRSNPILVDGPSAMIHGGSATPDKAPVDTTLLMGPQGSGATYIGDFEDGSGQPAWNGWVGVDLTDTGPFWHVDTYNVVSGTYSAWCGEMRYPSCEPGDPDGGYGNNYNEALEWRGAVADTNLACLVSVAALANYHTEPGYDTCYLSFVTTAGLTDVWSEDGQATGAAVDGVLTYQPGDYVEGEVVVQFRVVSDLGWSDEDCSYPTNGAMQLDDVVITLDDGAGTSHDFEDGTLGPFTVVDVNGAGNFAKIWTGLEDLDPCRTNYTPQVAFIDDGVVVPGTGGTPCINWCYGPNGFIVSTTSGLHEHGDPFLNAIESPPMAWPDPAHNGATLSFDSYRHETLTATMPGIRFSWFMRSVATGDPADLADALWIRGFNSFFGGPEYTTHDHDITALLVPGVTHVQVQLGINQNDQWGAGFDGTPAPYFDNVRLATYAVYGPVVTMIERNMSQDGFPEAGVFDPQNPAAASVRFDMAGDVTRSGDAGPTPGDSIVIDVVSVRPGGVVDGLPRMHYRLKANPDFDPYRTSGLPTVGSVACDSARYSSYVAGGKWFADLPDAGFLFPGDELHFYFEASDRVGADVQTNVLPADTTGFSDFTNHWAYDRNFTFSALPTVRFLDPGTGYYLQPEVLIWIDGATDQDWERWTAMLDELCLAPGDDYDLYRTNGTAVRNGLGDRSSLALVTGYDDIVYTSCALARDRTLGDGSNHRASPDVQLLSSWLDLGDRDLVALGDNLASDLNNGGNGTNFLPDRLGVDFIDENISPLIGGQTSPRVLATAGSFFFEAGDRWAVDASCPDLRNLDAVEPRSGTERSAEYGGWDGTPVGYPYGAVTLFTEATTQSRSVMVPYDLANVVIDPDDLPGSTSTRATVFADIMVGLDANLRWCISGVTPGEVPAVFSASIYPNPFNPTTRISYTVGRPGRLEVRIYDLRGRLVKTLVDDHVVSSGFVDWHGDDVRGAQVASGVYFYEVRMGKQVTYGKMALVR